MSRSGSPAFPATQHSLVHRLRAPDDGDRRAAFDALVRAYRAPVCAYLCREWHESTDDAEDLAQVFFATAWDRGFFAAFDASRARFRTYLRTCLDRQVLNARRAAQAQKRSAEAPTISLDALEGRQAMASAAPADADLDARFHEEFVRALLARTVQRLDADCQQRGVPQRFALFAACDLVETERPTYAQLAARFGIAVTQVTNSLHAARRRFRELALDELRELCATDDEYRDEAGALFGVTVP